MVQKLDTEVEENPYVSKFLQFFEMECKKPIEQLASEYPEKRSLNIDFKELERFDYKLADELLDNPEYLLTALQEAIEKIDVPSLEIEKFSPHIRFFNLPADRKPLLRDISSKHLNKLISVEGVIKQITDVLPKIKLASWKCRRCGNTYRTEQTTSQEIKQPAFCECRHRDFSLMEEESEFIDYQKITIQEPLEVLRGNEQPTDVNIYLSDDLVNKVGAGDKVMISGLLKLSPGKKATAIFGRFLDALHIEETSREFDEVEIAPEEEEEIKDLAKDPKIFEKLVASVAPAIYGHEIVKEAIILQLFGGVKKTLPGNQTIRGNAHVLLIGDPGVAKCVSGNTSICLSDGSFKKIDEIVNENLREAVNLDDGMYANLKEPINLPIMNSECKQVKGDAIRVFKRKPDKMFEVITQSGKKLEVTHTHPLFVCENAKVIAKRTDSLKKGDFIATPRKLDFSASEQKLSSVERGKTNAVHINFPEKVNSDFASFIGFQLAEGYTRTAKTTKHIRFVNSDKEVSEKFTKKVKALFKLSISNRTRNNATELICDSIELGRFLDKNVPELMTNSTKRTVPEKIMRSDNKIVKSFLKAFIESEGHVRKNTRRIEVCSASKKLIESIQILLFRFGIVSYIKQINNIATNGTMPEKKEYSKLTISGDFALDYLNKIGFITGRKQNRAKQVFKSVESNTNIDILPNLSNELKRIRKKLTLTQFDCGISRTTYQHYERGDRNPSRTKLYLIANNFHNKFQELELTDFQLEHDIANLMKLSLSNIFWDKVVSIKEIKSHEWVYDLEVAETHNFITNNVYSHNSQLLMSASKIAPKSIYVAGKTTTSVGLTASAVKDEFGEGGWTLKAGALVLASGGTTMADELDKMPSEDRSALHEAMEQGRISVAKAGIVTQFKTETSILAAANPKFSRFDPFASFMEQIDLPPTLISRFDLFFMIKDVLDKTKDSEIASHILHTHQSGQKLSQHKIGSKKLSKEDMEQIEKIATPAIDPEFLRKYISYARQNVFPALTKESMEALSDFYLGLRERGREEGQYSATHRQLEGLVRLSEASARVRLRNTIEKEDAERAIRLLRFSLEELVKDPETGKVDIDIISSGQTHSQVEGMRKILQIIKEKSSELDELPLELVYEEAKASGIEKEKTSEIIRKLEKKGEIYRPRHNLVKPTQFS